MQKLPNLLSTPAFDEIAHFPIFFILGRTRSGTTLLRSLFDAHNEVNIPPELPYLPLLYKNFGKNALSEKDIQKFVDTISLHFKFPMLRIDKNELLQILQDARKDIIGFNISHLGRIISYHYPSLFPKTRIHIIGDKNPNYSARIKMLTQVFPDARFIFIVRDYRDVAVSVLKQNFEIHNIPIIAFLWKKSVKQYLTYSKLYPHQFMMVRYEDFVEMPENKFSQICDFLKINFDPAVFSRIKTGTELQQTYGAYFNASHQSLVQPINTEKRGIYSFSLKRAQIRVADIVAGQYAELMGYERQYKGLQWLAIPRLAFAILLLSSAFLYNNFLKLISNKCAIKYGPLFRVLAFRLYGKRSKK